MGRNEGITCSADLPCRQAVNIQITQHGTAYSYNLYAVQVGGQTLASVRVSIGKPCCAWYSCSSALMHASLTSPAVGAECLPGTACRALELSPLLCLQFAHRTLPSATGYNVGARRIRNAFLESQRRGGTTTIAVPANAPPPGTQGTSSAVRGLAWLLIAAIAVVGS